MRKSETPRLPPLGVPQKCHANNRNVLDLELSVPCRLHVHPVSVSAHETGLVDSVGHLLQVSSTPLGPTVLPPSFLSSSPRLLRKDPVEICHSGCLFTCFFREVFCFSLRSRLWQHHHFWKHSAQHKWLYACVRAVSWGRFAALVNFLSLHFARVSMSTRWLELLSQSAGV